MFERNFIEEFEAAGIFVEYSTGKKLIELIELYCCSD